MDSFPLTVRNAIRSCSSYGKTTSDALYEAFVKQAPASLQEGPLAATYLLERSVYWTLHTLGPSTVRALFMDTAFRKSTFGFMQAWDAASPDYNPPPPNPKERGGPPISEAALRRIAPAMSGAANLVTAHALFDALTKDTSELSFDVWDKYLLALAKSEQQAEKQTAALTKSLGLQPGEVVLAEAGTSLDKWADGGSGHGYLTLTNRAIYFQGGSKQWLGPRRAAQRLDLTAERQQDVHSKRVGPMGTRIFDRALTISSDEWPEPWVLDFLEYSGHRQRDSWQAMIGEVLAAHDFIREYSPPVDDDEAVCAADVAARGASTAVRMAMEGVAHLQACQAALGVPPVHPERQLQFVWASKIPEGHLVEQALAVEIWGEGQAPVGFMQSLSSALRLSASSEPPKGTLEEGSSGQEELDKEGLEGDVDEILDDEELDSGEDQGVKAQNLGLRARMKQRRQRRRARVKEVFQGAHNTSAGRLPAVSTTGAVFQKQWMDSPTWVTDESLSFWREKNDEGLWVGGPLVVGGRTKLEKALEVGRSQERLAEKAQASIDGALVEGIPKNVDLLKELLYPVIIVIKFTLVKAPSWENPAITIITGLALLFLVNSEFLWLAPSVFILCMVLLSLFLRWTRHTAAMEPVVFLTKKPTSAVKKIIKLKEVLDTIGAILQAVNITLLKCRTLFYSDVPQETDKVLLAVVGLALVLLVLAWIPVRLLATLLILQIFSAKMTFRKPSKSSKQTFGRKLKRWWDTLPVAPVSMILLDQEEWDKEVKGVPMEVLDKEAIIHKLGKDAQLQSNNAVAKPTPLPTSVSESGNTVRATLFGFPQESSGGGRMPKLSKDLSKSMKVVSSFIDEKDAVAVL